MTSRLRALAGLDFHVFATLLFRGWTVVAGAGTVLLMPFVLGAVEQGYYFTFASLVALQVFFEMGLNGVVIQLVSHEVAHLSFGPRGDVAGEAGHRRRLADLFGLLSRWYRFAAAGFVVVVGVAGGLFFLRQDAAAGPDQLIPWLALVLAYGVSLSRSGELAVLEGLGQVGEVARLRLRQSMLGHGLMWLALLAGAGLWAVPLMPAVAAFATVWWLHRQAPRLQSLRAAATANDPPAVTWRRDVAPLQWRIAVSWMFGYLIFNLFTPALFAYQGPVEAGRVGMALTIFTTLLTVAMSWVTAKAPVLGQLIARAQLAESRALFAGLLWRSLAFTTLCCAGFSAALWAVQAMDLRLADRLPAMPVIACLVAATLGHAVVSAAATYMRAFKEEPMLPVSVVAGLLMLAAVHHAAQHSVLLTMQLYVAVTFLVSLPWTLALLRGYWRRGA